MSIFACTGVNQHVNVPIDVSSHFQSLITDMILMLIIKWNGQSPESLIEAYLLCVNGNKKAS